MDHSTTSKKNSLPICKNYADIEKYYGKVCEVHGVYSVTPVAGSKKLQPATIILEDGTVMLRSYRPVPEEYQFIYKRVVVIGTVFTDAGQPDYVQQVMSPHIFPESINLAPGEKPFETIPDRIPTPPMIESAIDLEKESGRWVHIYGILESVAKRENESTWADARLRFPDGSRIIIEWVALSRWEKYIKHDITATINIHFEDAADDTIPHIIVGMHSICPGKVLRCGMDFDETHSKPIQK